MDICYDLSKLQSLIKVIATCLVGPLGQHFLEQRKDFLS